MEDVVSKETIEKILAAQRAVSKLEAISLGVGYITAEDATALTWAVIEVTNKYLINHDPLSAKDLEKAEEIAQRYLSRNS